MGIINMVRTIKEIHKLDIIFIRIGKFYHVYGKDAYIISYLFNYKIKVLEGTAMCGFPLSSISKIIAKLEEMKINYLIVDRKNNYEVEEECNNKNLNNYLEYYEKSKKYINYKSRIDNIYKFMLDNVNNENFIKIIRKMEDVVNEGRKVSSN